MNTRQSPPGRMATALKLVLVLVVLGSGAGLAAYFIETKPVVQKKKPIVQAVFVETMPARLTAARAMVTGMGTVVPSQQITLRAQVSGSIVSLSEEFLPGGRIKKGEVILRIDPSDYQIEVTKSESELRKVRADLELEQGQQSVARQELSLLQESSEEPFSGTDLALRKPQLHQAQAQVAIAEAELARARLDLERTVLTAPFNALVLDRQVDLGAQVGTQEALATLVATDEYWIEAAIPADRLGFVDMRVQSLAAIHSQTGSGEWTGRILHSLGILDEDSRLAKVLISVANPLNGGGEALMLGDYVQVEIRGRELGEMFVLPRGALRRDDTVWIAGQGRLEIRPVEVALRSGETVYVKSGIEPGELIVLSDIAAPVPGMAVDLAGEEEAVSETGSNGSPETAGSAS